MENPRDRLNQALSLFQDFGPIQRRPIEDRWREAFPDATSEDMQQWKLFFTEIEAFAFKVGDKVVFEGLDETIGKETLIKQFPQLDEKSIVRTFSQCLYFAAK